MRINSSRASPILSLNMQTQAHSNLFIEATLNFPQ